MTGIEYTDRYGGKPLSLLRGCFGPCEAMGWVPVRHDEADAALRALWQAAEEVQPTDDGWHFVRCPACRGTGRVGWLRTVCRVPRWFCRGLRFTWMMGVVRNAEVRPSHLSWWNEFWLAFKCAFLVDLGLWKP